jgi:hypothetical protein
MHGMRIAAFAAVACLAATPAADAAETLRCASPKFPIPISVRIAAGRFELTEGHPVAWRDYCRPSD